MKAHCATLIAHFISLTGSAVFFIMKRRLVVFMPSKTQPLAQNIPVKDTPHDKCHKRQVSISPLTMSLAACPRMDPWALTVSSHPSDAGPTAGNQIVWSCTNACLPGPARGSRVQGGANCIRWKG
eukprot:1139526-Pelagomonas_calceolata.AAC.4